ncbi:unnamed protein product [Meloidogyne enterolobii]|uniref:Uncharacterized protein n=1 Tax=Meloidogyne enterolobii TaxID=390850 RepID=A0ACB0YHT8_MELEN
MSSTNYNNETFNELMENEGLRNLEDSNDIGGNNEKIRVENQMIEENKNLKNRKQSTKPKRNLNPIPTECSICERIAARGYLFYGVICCDGINLNVYI